MLGKGLMVGKLSSLFRSASLRAKESGLSSPNYALGYLEYLRRCNHVFARVALEESDFDKTGHITKSMPSFGYKKLPDGQVQWSMQRNDVVIDPRIPDQFNEMQIIQILDVAEVLNEALDSLPDSIQELFKEFGTEYRVVARLEDYNPDFRDTKMRGSKGSYVYQAGAVYSPSCVRVVIPAFIFDDNYGSVLEKYRDRGSIAYKETIFHELGHALDEILDVTNISKQDCKLGLEYQDDFLAARREDAMKLAPEFKDVMSYYLSEDEGGGHKDQYDAASEIFAQLFAEWMMGYPYNQVTKLFPKSSMVFQRIIQSLNCQITPLPNYLSVYTAIFDAAIRWPLYRERYNRILESVALGADINPITVEQLRHRYFENSPV